MSRNRIPFFAGLFLTTCATLQIEILCTRLLSVMTGTTCLFSSSPSPCSEWLAAPSGHTTKKNLFNADTAPAVLSRYSVVFAVSIPVCHAVKFYASRSAGSGHRWT